MSLADYKWAVWAVLEAGTLTQEEGDQISELIEKYDLTDLEVTAAHREVAERYWAKYAASAQSWETAERMARIQHFLGLPAYSVARSSPTVRKEESLSWMVKAVPIFAALCWLGYFISISIQRSNAVSDLGGPSNPFGAAASGLGRGAKASDITCNVLSWDGEEITGTLKNVGSNPAVYIEIGIEFVDEKGVSVGSTMHNEVDVQPGQKLTWRVVRPDGVSRDTRINAWVSRVL